MQVLCSKKKPLVEFFAVAFSAHCDHTQRERKEKIMKNSSLERKNK